MCIRDSLWPAESLLESFQRNGQVCRSFYTQNYCSSAKMPYPVFPKVADPIAIFFNERLHFIQSFNMANRLIHFWEKSESFRSFFPPADNHLMVKHPVKSGIQLN